MVSLDKIYTRGGDEGKTSLGSGERVAKHDLRVAAYGTSDEANAVIGIARLHTAGKADDMLARIQNDLFDLGADLCTPKSAERRRGTVRTISPSESTPARTSRSRAGSPHATRGSTRCRTSRSTRRPRCRRRPR